MSILDAVSNAGQKMIDAVDQAIDSAVEFVSDLPPAQTPDAIYTVSDKCDWLTLGLESKEVSKEVQDKCWERLNQSFQTSRILTMTNEQRSEAQAQPSLLESTSRFLDGPNPLLKVINAENRAPDVEACVPWFFGGDSECMNDADEFIPVIGTVTIAAGAIAAGAAITGIGATTTVITASAPIMPAAGLVLSENPRLGESVTRFLSSNLSERVTDNFLLRMFDVLGL